MNPISFRLKKTAKNQTFIVCWVWKGIFFQPRFIHMAFTPHQTCLLEFFFQVARMRGGGHLHLHNQLVSCGLADIDNIVWLESSRAIEYSDVKSAFESSQDNSSTKCNFPIPLINPTGCNLNCCTMVKLFPITPCTELMKILSSTDFTQYTAEEKCHLCNRRLPKRRQL